MKAMAAGDECLLTLRVAARVIKRSDAHGVCYLIQLDRRDYQEERTIWIDEDEIDQWVGGADG